MLERGQRVRESLIRGRAWRDKLIVLSVHNGRCLYLRLISVLWPSSSSSGRPPFPMRHECVYFVNCANMCHDPSRLLFRSCAENCSGRVWRDRSNDSLSLSFSLYLSLSHLLVLGNIFLVTPRWWLPLPRAERAVRVINMADILFNPLGSRLWFNLARFYRATRAIIRQGAWCSVNILEG